ncbi:zinc finger domain-containing protein [Streptomyces sp. HC307]|uniref:zinc finger domain-containing protein n=1 Tax=Streptomyces flavusporus TaxID=3385496 RepID=UPI003917601C
MTLHAGAPMPAELRHQMRAKQRPARSVPCPHCGAAAHRPCVLRTTGRQLPQPHPQRVSEWARTVACCPDCQVEPTTPCHDEGRARTTVHNRRYQEAEATAA